MPVLEKPYDLCCGCELWELDKQGFIHPEGKGTSGVLLMGEAGGQRERQDGLPFRPYAPAGSILERAIRRIDMTRDQFVLSNIVTCSTPRDWLDGAPWEMGSIAHCEVHRDRLLKQFKPKCIVALGGVSFRTLTGHAGPKQTISLMRGYPIDTPQGWVIGSYHPAFIARGQQRLIGVLMHDILKAVKIARHGHTTQPVQYNIHPTLEDCQQFLADLKAHPEWLLAFDIETGMTASGNEEEYGEEEDHTDIIQIQFSATTATGICFPWIDPFISIAKEILALGHEKVAHNGYRYDVVKLKAAGVAVNGVLHDTMWAYHHMQPDLQGHYNLQSVASFYGMPQPWKHLMGGQLEWYGCADVDACQRIWAKLPADMKAKGVWRGYEQHVLKLEPILVDMTARGIHIDEAARLELATRLETDKRQSFQTMQSLVPDELKNIHPKQGYIKEPKDTTEMVKRWFTTTATVDGVRIERQVERWCKLEDFTPSSQQLLRFMKFRKHLIPRHTKEDRDTTEAKAILQLSKSTKDPLYTEVLHYREVEKLLSTYVEGWKPATDGRVHPEFVYWPATGQLSSRRPNAQNVIKHKEIAASFRKVIAARLGYTLVELDYKSFHSQTLGFEARDPDFIRLAKIDIHSYLAADMMGEPADITWPDDQLRDYLFYIKKKHKRIRDTRAKQAVLGIGFGEGAHRLFVENPDIYKNKADAKRVLDNLDALFPKTARFREDIKKLAHHQTYLISRHGYMRWFWDVFKWDSGSHSWKSGEQAEAAIAFLPANDAFGHIKDAMLRLEERGLLKGLANTIHDSLLFELPAIRLNDCLETVWAIKEEMERPSTILVDPIAAPTGLSVEVEVAIGRNWSEMQTLSMTSQPTAGIQPSPSIYSAAPPAVPE